MVVLALSTTPLPKHPPNRAVWDDSMAGMDYKGAHGVLARVLTCSALTAPAGQSCLALLKPNQLQKQLQGFCKEPCEGRTCWPAHSRVPERGCPQEGDLGESASTQAQCSKASHTVESVENTAFPSVPTMSSTASFPLGTCQGATALAAHSMTAWDVPWQHRELVAH